MVFSTYVEKFLFFKAGIGHLCQFIHLHWGLFSNWLWEWLSAHRCKTPISYLHGYSVTRILSWKFVDDLKTALLQTPSEWGVWQTLPFHLPLRENKARQLLIINNREMSRREPYPIRTSPVNPAGKLAEPGKWTMLCTLLKWAYLSFKFKVSDETCNSSWVQNLISKIEDRCGSII